MNSLPSSSHHIFPSSLPITSSLVLSLPRSLSLSLSSSSSSSSTSSLLQASLELLGRNMELSPSFPKTRHSGEKREKMEMEMEREEQEQKGEHDLYDTLMVEFPSPTSGFSRTEMEEEEGGCEGDFLYESESCSLCPLSDDVLVIVFSFLDPLSFLSAASTCKKWKQIASIPSFWPKRTQLKWTMIQLQAAQDRQLCDILDSTITTKNQAEGSSYTRQVKFLKETLDELHSIAMNRLSAPLSTHYCHRDYSSLLHGLLCQLRDGEDVLRHTISRSISLTSNFDMVDFTLRRSIRQIDAMFPSPNSLQVREERGGEGERGEENYSFAKKKVSGHPLLLTSLPDAFPHRDASVIIRDPLAREFWDKFVGCDVHCVPFDYFMDKILQPNFPHAFESPIFRSYLSFFLHFPRDGFVTTYKWSVIVDQFGPFPHFVSNFLKYACGLGFLGLMNTVEAEGCLRRKHEFLIRFSRLEPEKLTFSFVVEDSHGRLVHRHTRKPLGVTIDDFIQSKFPSRQYFLSSTRMSPFLIQHEDLLTYSIGVPVHSSSHSAHSSSSPTLSLSLSLSPLRHC